MAARAPIVASDIVAVREIVDDRAAVLVPVDHPGEMAAAIAALLDDPTAAQERALVANERFRSLHSPAVIAAEMVAFYDRALGRSGQGA
jgi:glycogen(starch) synthase